MKKIISVLMIILLVPCLCFAGTYHKEIKLQGGYESVAAVIVESIPVQSEGFRMGMPFPIDDPTAQYDSTGQGGRRIATWSILSNQEFLLDIKAEALHNYSENDVTGPYPHGLGYILRFHYELSYTSGKTAFTDKKDILIEVNSSVREVVLENHNLLEGLDLKPGSLSGFAEGEIYFCFDQATDKKIKNKEQYDTLLDGNYNATVTLTLKAKQ